MLIEPLTGIGRFFYVGAIGRAAAAQIRELLGVSVQTDRPDRSADLPAGAISVRSAAFTYPDGSRALDEITLDVDPGERVALVGRPERARPRWRTSCSGS